MIAEYMIRMAEAFADRGFDLAPGGLLVPKDKLHITVAERWHISTALAFRNSGYQVINVGHRLCASLLATSGPADLHLPWESFGIRIPKDTYYLDSGDVEFVIFNKLPAKTHTLQIKCFSRITEVQRCVNSLNELCEYNERGAVESDQDQDPTWDKVSSKNARALFLTGRLILGVIAELEGTYVKRSLALSDKFLTKPAQAKAQTHILTRPVIVDVRQAVREYSQGGGRSPSVRTLVRGHWRHQVCGPKNILRKWIHIEPHWKGPEVAPIAIRPHIFKEQA